MRASLSLFLCVGNCLAVAALALAGRLPAPAVEVGLFFMACAGAGFAAGAWFRRFLDAGRLRMAVLLTAAASAAILITHSLVA